MDCTRSTFFSQISGTTNVADNPITKLNTETQDFSDTEDIYSYEKEREAITPYPPRTTELLAIDTAVSNDVKIYVHPEKG